MQKKNKWFIYDSNDKNPCWFYLCTRLRLLGISFLEIVAVPKAKRPQVRWTRLLICISILSCARGHESHGSPTVSHRRSKTYLPLVKLAVNKLRCRLDLRGKQASQFLRMQKSHDKLRHRASNIRENEYLSVTYKTLCEEFVFALRQRNSVTQSTTDATKRASGIINHRRPKRWLARSTRKRTPFWACQSNCHRNITLKVWSSDIRFKLLM